MGVDFFVEKGNVRLTEAETLVRELLQLAAELELDVIPVNWIVSGEVYNGVEMLDELLGYTAKEHWVPRPVVRIHTVTDKSGSPITLRRYGIEQELIQGVVFCHPGELVRTSTSSTSAEHCMRAFTAR
jgi:hypothetical protein